jgi:hypothetical protein
MATIPRPLRAAARILIVSLLFLAAFGLSAILIACLLGLLRGSDPAGPENVFGGLICGLIAWLFVAVFHLKREHFSWPVTDPDNFLLRVRTLLEEWGYELEKEGTNHLVYRPGFHAFLLGGRIQVSLDGTTAKASGPKLWLEALRQRLRFQTHVDKARQPFAYGKINGERFLKRIQITLRLTADQWTAFGDQVLAPLSKEATVVCDLNVLVQSEAGVRERLLDGPVRQWLLEQNVPAEVHKDFVQMELAVNAQSWQPVGDK